MTDTILPASESSASLKRLFATLHLWVGVIIGIPAAILGATGIFLMVTHPLPTKVTAESFAPIASIDAILAAARAAVPEGRPQQVEAAPAGEPINVRLSVPRTDDNPRGVLRVQVDPNTLAVKAGEAQSETSIARIAHDLHGSFMIGREGRPVVGWVGVFMCGLALSGIVLWWPRRGRWRAAFKISGKGTRWMVLREIHGAAGIWGLIVFFIISFTGVLVAFPPAGAAGPGGRDGGRSASSPIELHADAAVAQVLKDRSDYVLRALSLPRGPQDPYKVSIMQAGIDRYVPPVTVTVDATGAQVLEVKNVAEDARAWARPVHVGGGMGMVWWILTLLSGILPVIFAVTGIWMWLITRRNKARMAERAQSA